MNEENVTSSPAKLEMTLNQYQQACRTSAVYPDKLDMGIVYTGLGLAGEAGECADKIKKVLRDHGGVFSDEQKLKIAMEAGDALWYIAELAGQLGFSLEDLAVINLNKLKVRKAVGKLHGEGDDR